VVFKEFKTSKEAGYSRRPAGPLLQTDMANWSFFYPTEVAYRGFPPLNYRGFPPVNTQVFSPMIE
jgi:hypothetical protein